MSHAVLALLSLAVIGSSMAGFQQSSRQSTTPQIQEPKLYVAFSAKGAGYIDKDGKWVIQPEFSDAYDFVGGRAITQKGERYQLIDRTGKVVFEFPETYEWMGRFSDGLAPAYDGERIGYVGLDGSVKIPFEYDWIYNDEITGEFNGGLAVVSKGEMSGVINTSGRVVLPIEFDYIWDFSDGAALAKRGDEEGAINTRGRFIFLDSEDAYIVDSYQNGLAPAVLADFVGSGYIDKVGNWAIKAEFDMVGKFSGIYAAVAVDGLVGFIDQAGRYVIEPKFPIDEESDLPMAGTFEKADSLCWVSLGAGEYGYINKSGEIVISGGYEYADDFKDGLALVMTGTHIGYIGLDGEWVYRITLDELFGDGLLTALKR